MPDLEFQELEIIEAIKTCQLAWLRGLLREKELDLFLVDKNKNTILHVAAMYPNYRIFEFIVSKISHESICNINAKNAQGDSILHVLIKASYLNPYISNRGVPLISVSLSRVPFFYYRLIDFAKLLINKGLNPNVCNEHGDTALHLTAIALDNNCRLISEFYLSSNVLIKYLFNIDKKNPLDLMEKVPKSNTVVKLLNNISTIEDILLVDLDATKPNFVKKNEQLVKIWDNVKSKLEKEKEGLIQDKLWGVVNSKNKMNFALMSRNEKVTQIMLTPDFISKYPLYGSCINYYYEIGLARNIAETTALNSVFFYNTNRKLDPYLWRKILENLEKDELKEVTKVSNLGIPFTESDFSFFKQLSDSNESLPNLSDRNESLPSLSNN